MIDWTSIWNVVGPAVAGLGTWLLTRKTSKAKLDAAVAAAKADTAVSDAEGSLYRRLREDVDALSGQVDRLRTELEASRRHIWRLERMLVELGGIPPHFDLNDYKVGLTD